MVHKRLVSKIIIIASVALILAPGSWAKAPTVRTQLVVDTIMIGDQVNLEVDIEKDITTEIMIPQFENNIMVPKIEVLGMPTLDTIERDGRRVVIRLRYLITSFDAGKYSLGGFPIVYTERGVSDTIFATDIVELIVQTFDIDTTKQQIADIKPPLETPLIWSEVKELVLYSLLVAILLTVAIYYLIRHLKKRKDKIRLAPDAPPHIIAIAALERLAAQKLPNAGRYKEYYSTLTDILRKYIEGRYGIWAMEMTTSEIIRALRDVNNDKLMATLGELFSLADLVKFAKWTPEVENCKDAYQVAYYYIEETKMITIKSNESDEA